MRVLEERILPVSLVCKRHLLPRLNLLLLTHSLQNLLILPIQHSVVPPQNHDHKAQGTQSSNDADFS